MWKLALPPIVAEAALDTAFGGWNEPFLSSQTLSRGPYLFHLALNIYFLKVISSLFGLDCVCCDYLRRVWHWFLTPVGHQAITWLAHIFLLEGASKIVFVTVGKVWSDEWQVYVYKCMSQRQMGGGCIQSPSLKQNTEGTYNYAVAGK